MGPAFVSEITIIIQYEIISYWLLSFNNRWAINFALSFNFFSLDVPRSTVMSSFVV